jgi:hypothetical protein
MEEALMIFKLYRFTLISFGKHQHMVGLMKQTDMSEREIARWWRRKRAQNKWTTLDKFCDNCWRCAFYSFNFTFGLSVLWDKSWLWNFFDMFRDYPFHVSVSRVVATGKFMCRRVPIPKQLSNFYLTLFIHHLMR